MAASSTTTTTDFVGTFERVKELASQQKLFAAADLYEQLEISLKLHSASSENDADLRARAQRFLSEDIDQQKNFIEALKYDVANCRQLVHDIDHDDGWELAEDKKGIQCFLKNDPDLAYTLVTLKGRCDMECPVQNIAMQMNEIDLYEKWVPLVKEGANVLEMSPYDKMMHVKFNFPLPISMVMSSRDLVFHGYVVDDMEHNTWVVNVRDATTEEQDRMRRDYNFTIPGPPPKYVRVNLVNGGMVLRPISRNKVRVQCMLSINPQLNLPTTVVNVLTRKFGYMFFEMLNKRACKLDKEYLERLNFELYTKMRESLERAFDA